MTKARATFRISSILCAAALLLLGACEHRTRSGTTSASKADTTGRLEPTHVSWDANFTLLSDGARRAILSAPRMEQYTAGDTTFSVWRSPSDSARVWAYLFDERGDSSATVRADSLVFQEDKGRLDAYGNVVVVSENEKRLRSEHLIWDQNDRRIRTRRFVRIVTPEEVVQGNGLVAQEDLETYQIGRFTAEVRLEEDTTQNDQNP